MRWEELLSAKRCRGGQTRGRNAKSSDLRSEFEKDYHRIIGSASFRRLQDKTQVFPLDKSDFIRTRLTHSLEVSSFAKSLGQNIGENILVYKKDSEFTPQMKEDICNILQCAGLIHDIGNPPFGHFGEDVIREWFERKLPLMTYHGKPMEQVMSRQMVEDLYHFEGNAQALRLVTKLHFLVDEHGMNLTYALLNTIVKYPVPSHQMDPHSEDIKKKVFSMFTDPNHIRVEDPGSLEGNTVFTYLDAFCKPEYFAEFLPEYQNLDELKAHYQRGGLGDMKVKRFLNNVLQAEVEPIRNRRKELQKDIPAIYEILKKGSEKAEAVAAQTLKEVKDAMKINYFDDKALIEAQAERFSK